MCSLQRNYDVIRNWERFETGPLTVLVNTNLSGRLKILRDVFVVDLDTYTGFMFYLLKKEKKYCFVPAKGTFHS